MLFPLILASCALTEQKSNPERISGVWELDQVVTAEGPMDGRASILRNYPGCIWGRTTFAFSEAEMVVGLDILCPSGTGDYYGCEVQAAVPATWNPALGQWNLAYPAAVRERTAGLDAESIAGPTQCEVSVNAGVYEVERVYPKDGDWRWEIRAPGGVIYRLGLPRSERPDFVSAIREKQPTVPR
jgi:hypothetical protein